MVDVLSTNLSLCSFLPDRESLFFFQYTLPLYWIRPMILLSEERILVHSTVGGTIEAVGGRRRRCVLWRAWVPLHPRGDQAWDQSVREWFQSWCRGVLSPKSRQLAHPTRPRRHEFPAGQCKLPWHVVMVARIILCLPWRVKMEMQRRRPPCTCTRSYVQNTISKKTFLNFKGTDFVYIR